jgi:hypothetical protein
MGTFENLKILLFFNFCICDKQIRVHVHLIMNTEGTKCIGGKVYDEQQVYGVFIYPYVICRQIWNFLAKLHLHK